MSAPLGIGFTKRKKDEHQHMFVSVQMFDESSWFLSHYYARVFLSLSEHRASPDQLLSSFGTSNASQRLERA
jgi:hypothetical protein